MEEGDINEIHFIGSFHKPFILHMLGFNFALILASSLLCTECMAEVLRDKGIVAIGLPCLPGDISVFVNDRKLENCIEKL